MPGDRPPCPWEWAAVFWGLSWEHPLSASAPGNLLDCGQGVAQHSAMCRALLYLGEPVLLDNLLFRPDSALVRQSYGPKMLHLLNLAGFGMRAWDRETREPQRPFAYASESIPVFDRNLKSLAEKVFGSCVLAHVRGVPYDTAAEVAPQNVHPFQFPGVPLALAHNGDLAGIE